MSEFNDRVTHFYLQTDGSIKWPNSAEGDLLKIAYVELNQAAGRIEELEYHLKGIAGGSVYRHSHEPVEKELAAVRRFARRLLEDQP